MKENNGNGFLLCPTRIDSSSPQPIITHLISKELCLQRQREFFHKCHSCKNSMSWQAKIQIESVDFRKTQNTR